MYSVVCSVSAVTRSAILSNGCMCARPLPRILSPSSSFNVSPNNTSSEVVSLLVSRRAMSTDASQLLRVDLSVRTSEVRTFHHWTGSGVHSLVPHQVNYEQVRYGASSFFTRYPAETLWKAVTSVSSAGRRRGRGKKKDKRATRDLNKGQILGVGKANIRWPGLSAPIIKGREIVQRQHLPPDEKYAENLNKIRDAVYKYKKAKVPAIDRGWSGGHAGGRKIGPPDPVGDETFEGFNTVILHQKPVVHQTSHQGRHRTLVVICGTGNGKGLFGYGWAKAPDAKAAQRKAKNRGAQKLMYIPLWENRTLHHNFFSQFGTTKVYAWPRGPGFGLRCHRVIKSMCELIGIKDMYCKCEGGKATQHVMYAFLLGLLRQKTYEELAEETGYHVVELRQSRDYFPNVVATPSNPIESADEVPDLDLYCVDNNVFLGKRPRPPLFMIYNTWNSSLKKLEYVRSHFKSNVQLRATYDGELRSFLTDKYPECKPWLPRWTRSLKEAKKKEEAKAE